ncbi:MAG: hypothetical protein ACK50J_03735, partial [Planctomyces sp.]
QEYCFHILRRPERTPSLVENSQFNSYFLRVLRVLRVLRDLRVEKQIAQKDAKTTKEDQFGRAKLLLSRYRH